MVIVLKNSFKMLKIYLSILLFSMFFAVLSSCTYKVFDRDVPRHKIDTQEVINTAKAKDYPRLVTVPEPPEAERFLKRHSLLREAFESDRDVNYDFLYEKDNIEKPYQPHIATLYFDQGSFSISDKENLILKKVMRFQKKIEKPIKVIGHRNQSPLEAKDLSGKRSKVVRDKLILLGLSRELVTALDSGDQNPIYKEDTDNGRAGNRRVEIIVEE